MEQVSNFPAALDFYSQCLALDPIEHGVRYLADNNSGYSLKQLLEYEEAEPYCRRAIEIDPDRLKAYKNLGAAGGADFMERMTALHAETGVGFVLIATFLADHGQFPRLL